MAVEATQWSSVPQELQQARNEIPIESPDFLWILISWSRKNNIDATARTVPTKFTAIRVHMNSVLGDIINSFKSNLFRVARQFLLFC
ncbi:hypothetical protein TNCV_3371321 [Trichonephila clavipes]|nr:hypothetical protein TNCV_3371321 [Trichonephila clavipes]